VGDLLLDFPFFSGLCADYTRFDSLPTGNIDNANFNGCNVGNDLRPRAVVEVLTTEKNFNTRAVQPLYRLSRTRVVGAATVSKHKYVVGDTAKNTEVSAGWLLDGIEGFVHPASVSKPPSGVALCRAYNAATDDFILFSAAAGSACTSITETISIGDNPSASGLQYIGGVQLGWAYVLTDTETDGDNDGMPNAVEVAEGRNRTIKDNDIFVSASTSTTLPQRNRWFAQQQYREFLSREGESGGVSFWVGELNANRQIRATMIESFLTSGEFNENVAPVIRLYLAALERFPDYGGALFWIDYVTRDGSLAVAANLFAESPEFKRRYGSLDNAGFVDRVYRNVLGRAPDDAGFNY
jgi:Domain of unknown function (DUF4214)